MAVHYMILVFKLKILFPRLVISRIQCF